MSAPRTQQSAAQQQKVRHNERPKVPAWKEACATDAADTLVSYKDQFVANPNKLTLVFRLMGRENQWWFKNELQISYSKEFNMVQWLKIVIIAWLWDRNVSQKTNTKSLAGSIGAN